MRQPSGSSSDSAGAPGATGRASYSGNADAGAIAARLRQARSAVVLTHAKPDGDAIGSMLASLRLLRALGAAATGWIVGPVDFSLQSFLEGERLANPASIPSAVEPDLVLVVDTGSWQQLDSMAEWVRARAERTVIVDHHRSGDPAMAALRLIDPGCASTTQALLRVADAAGVPLDADGAGGVDDRAGAARVGLTGSIAEALFIGLATDTGWFRFSNADAAVFDAAARLLRAGVEKDRLYRQIEETARPGRLRLLAKALASLELLAEDRAALMVLPRAEMQSTGGGAEDLSGIVNAPMVIGSVEVSVLATEPEPGVVKLSFRSKPPWTRGGAFVDVDRLAAGYGGGGHVHAAGAKSRGALAEVLDRVRADLRALPRSTPGA